MGFSSQSGQVGFRTQTAKGTFADPGTGGLFIRTRSGSLGGNRELLVPDPEVGGHRDVPDAYLGVISFSGEYEMYMRYRAIALMLKSVLGAATTVDNVDLSFTHTITPADTLPWLSIEEVIANNYESYRYTDAMVNSLHLEAEADGYLMGNVGLLALTQVADIVKTANPTWDTTPLTVGTKITVDYGGIRLPAKSFNLDVTNNIEDDDKRLGSLTIGDLTPKRRELTMGVTIRPEDSTLWKAATYGSASASAPAGGLAAKDDVVITIQSYENVDTGVPFKVELQMAQAAIVPFKVEPSGDDVLEHDLEIRALRPSTATPLITAVVTNDAAIV